MELSDTNVKEFLIFPDVELCTLAQAQKIKKSILRKFIIFQKISHIFCKESFSYILGNGNSKKILYISGNRTFLYFMRELPGSKNEKSPL